MGERNPWKNLTVEDVVSVMLIHLFVRIFCGFHRYNSNLVYFMLLRFGFSNALRS